MGRPRRRRGTLRAASPPVRPSRRGRGSTGASDAAASPRRRRAGRWTSIRGRVHARLCDEDAEIAELGETLAAPPPPGAARVEEDKAEEGGGAHSDADALANAAEAEARASEAQANAAEAEARASEAQASRGAGRAPRRARRDARLERDLASARGDLAGVRAALRDAELDVKASADRAARPRRGGALDVGGLLTLRRASPPRPRRRASAASGDGGRGGFAPDPRGRIARVRARSGRGPSAALGGGDRRSGGRARRRRVSRPGLETRRAGLDDARRRDRHRGDERRPRTTRALRQSEFQATRESDRAAALERESADLRASIASHRDAWRLQGTAEESAAEIAAARLEARAAERGRVTYLRELEAAEAGGVRETRGVRGGALGRQVSDSRRGCGAEGGTKAPPSGGGADRAKRRGGGAIGRVRRARGDSNRARPRAPVRRRRGERREGAARRRRGAVSDPGDAK